MLKIWRVWKSLARCVAGATAILAGQLGCPGSRPDRRAYRCFVDQAWRDEAHHYADVYSGEANSIRSPPAEPIIHEGLILDRRNRLVLLVTVKPRFLEFRRRSVGGAV